MPRIFPRRSSTAMVLAGLLVVSTTGNADEPMVYTVRIQAFTFVPARLEVEAGDAVIWINQDLAPHTATSGDQDWDTGPLDRDQAGRVTFAAPGTFTYRCLYHPQMRGEIVVVNDGAGREPSRPRPASQVR